MKRFRSLFAWWTDDAGRARSSVVRGRRAPACESLEGRQLLTAGVGGNTWLSYGGPGGMAGGALPAPADIHLIDATGAVRGDHAKGVEFMHSGAGKGGFAKFNASPQLKADFTTLTNDMMTLQSEIPASLTATLKADQAVVAKALGLQTPTTPKAGQPGDHVFIARAAGAGADTNSPVNIVSKLEKAGVSSSQATQISTDFQTYQTTLKSLDPTLQTKITADQAAIAKDGGPAFVHGHGKVDPVEAGQTA